MRSVTLVPFTTVSEYAFECFHFYGVKHSHLIAFRLFSCFWFETLTSRTGFKSEA